MAEELAITISAKDAASGIVSGIRKGIQANFSRLKSGIAMPFVGAKKIAVGALRGIKVAAIAATAAIAAGFAVLKFAELGANLALVRKGFEKLTGTSGETADKLVADMKRAASGVLSEAQAMAKVNQLISSGLNIEQIRTIFEFGSKAAAAFGKDAVQAIDTLATGMARGSTMMLDDYGVLTKGIRGVAEEYEKLHGKDTWGKLAQDAQKAIVVNAALEEMKEKIEGMGLSGKESAVSIKGLYASMKDLAAGLSQGISESTAFGDAISWGTEKLKEMTEWAKGFSLDAMVANIKGVGEAWMQQPGFAAKAMTHVGDFVYAGVKAAVQSMWDVIKGSAAIMWEPIKFAAKGLWAVVIRGARDAASGFMHAWQWISAPIKKLFGKIAEFMKKPIGDAMIAIGELLVKLQEKFPDIARIPGLENIGEQIVALGGNIQRTNPMKAIKDGIEEGRAALAKFDAETVEMSAKHKAQLTQDYAEMWNNMFGAGAATIDDIKKRFSEMTAAQKAEWSALMGHLGSVMPGGKKGAGGGAPSGGGQSQAMKDKIKKEADAADWLKRAGKKLNSAGKKLEKAAKAFPKTKAQEKAEKTKAKFEGKVQKEMKAALEGRAGGMSRERQAARREAVRRIQKERGRRAEAAFGEKEGELAEKVKKGKMTGEEATEAREKFGKRAFGKKGWEAREAERRGKPEEKKKKRRKDYRPGDVPEGYEEGAWDLSKARKPGREEKGGKKKGKGKDGLEKTADEMAQSAKGLEGKVEGANQAVVTKFTEHKTALDSLGQKYESLVGTLNSIPPPPG